MTPDDKNKKKYRVTRGGLFDIEVEAESKWDAKQIAASKLDGWRPLNPIDLMMEAMGTCVEELTVEEIENEELT